MLALEGENKNQGGLTHKVELTCPKLENTHKMCFRRYLIGYIMLIVYTYFLLHFFPEESF